MHDRRAHEAPGAAAEPTFYWYDLETSGRDPRWHRIVQFAGLRTDANLEPLSEVHVSQCRLSDEVLPEPGAVLITGILPSMLSRAPREASLMRRIEAQFRQPNTCVAGFNSLSFDDEFIRYSFWRNFIDPYAREFRDGNSRWDLMDLVRAARALRPEGLVWPESEDGRGSLRLADLAAANGIIHEHAHDAASDVLATVELARRLRAAQPRLFEHYLGLRDKQRVLALLGQPLQRILVYVARGLPREQMHLAAIAVLGPHPVNRNAVIAFDLNQNPEVLAGLGSGELRERMYARGEDLPFERPRLYEIRINKVPFLAPLGVLRGAPAATRQVDPHAAAARLGWLAQRPEVVRAACDAFCREEEPEREVDPDAALYDGFVSDADRAVCERIQRLEPEELARFEPHFEDARLSALFPRFKARNWPALLTTEEAAAWRAFVRGRLLDEARGVAEWWVRWRALREAGGDPALLDALARDVRARLAEYDVA